MPGLNGTGPLGRGPMTGRGMGFCVMRAPEGARPTPGRGTTENVQQAITATGEEVAAMPAGNGTGPLGFGPMTGRAAGFCAGFPVPGYMNPALGRAYGAAPVAAGYAPTPYAGAMVPYGYPAAYARAWPRPVGWFGRGFGAGWGRGFGRGFGRGGRGRGRFGW